MSTWTYEEDLGDGLLRIRRDGRSAWFTAVPDEAALLHEGHVWTRLSQPEAEVGDVDGVPGLAVQRCAGGPLAHALRLRGGVEEAYALGVLDEVLEAVGTAPEPPAGATRLTLGAFAVDGDGRIRLLPGRLRSAAERTDTSVCGEIVHLALTGLTWEEAGQPLHVTAPRVGEGTRALVADLLEGSAPEPGLRALRRRVQQLGARRMQGFLPAEPGVAVDEAPTGVLGAELVAQLRRDSAEDRAAPVRRGAGERTRRSAARARRRRPRERLDAAGSAAGRSGRSRRRKSGTAVTAVRIRPGRWTAGAAGLSVLGIGVWLMVAGAGGGSENAAGSAPQDGGRQERAVAATAEAPLHTAPPAEAGPAEAFAALSHARGAAVREGDDEALAALTVPGSPAARADAAGPLTACADCGDLTLTDVTVVSEDATEAVLRARMRAGGQAWTPITVELQRHSGEWLVFSVAQ